MERSSAAGQHLALRNKSANATKEGGASVVRVRDVSLLCGLTNEQERKERPPRQLGVTLTSWRKSDRCTGPGLKIREGGGERN